MSTQNPIAHACRLLRETAKELQQAHTRGDRDDWAGEPEAKAAFDEYMAVAEALGALASAASAEQPSMSNVTHDWRDSPSYGGEICANCGAVNGTRQSKLACGQKTETPQRRWPFAETPGEFTERLREAMQGSGDLLAAVRHVLIERPALVVPHTPLAAAPAPQPDAAYAELRTNYLDLLQEVMDAKDVMLAAGCPQDSFGAMFAEYSASRGQAPAGADLAFMLKTARLLAELHGESVLSEQQCAKHMGIDLVSWRRLEDCFSGGVFMPEGGGAELPREDSESVLREALGLAPAPAPSVLEDAALPQAARDVLAERQRQISTEGWTPEHDDEHVNDEIAAMACYYVMPPGAREWSGPDGYGATLGEAIRPEGWDAKDCDRRRELVKGAALALAELERIDRAATAAKKGG